jgi:hypothetical protein
MDRQGFELEDKVLQTEQFLLGLLNENGSDVDYCRIHLWPASATLPEVVGIRIAEIRGGKSGFSYMEPEAFDLFAMVERYLIFVLDPDEVLADEYREHIVDYFLKELIFEGGRNDD